MENVLVSLHSLKTMDLGPIIFKECRVARTFSYTYSTIETKEAARIGYNGLLFPHEYSVLKQQTLNALSFVLWF